MSILDDPRFHALPREAQRETLVRVSKKFAALAPEKQEEFLASRFVPGYVPFQKGKARSASAGMQGAMAHVEKTFANAADLVGLDRLSTHLRTRATLMENLARGGEPETTGEKIAYAASVKLESYKTLHAVVEYDNYDNPQVLCLFATHKAAHNEALCQAERQCQRLHETWYEENRTFTVRTGPDDAMCESHSAAAYIEWTNAPVGPNIILWYSTMLMTFTDE